MSSAMRPSSPSGSEVALLSMSTSSRLRMVSSVMRKSCSCENLLRLDQRAGEAVDLVPGVVERERRPAGRGHAEAIEQRHHAMRAGTHRDAGAVDDSRNIVGMRALHL